MEARKRRRRHPRDDGTDHGDARVTERDGEAVAQEVAAQGAQDEGAAGGASRRLDAPSQAGCAYRRWRRLRRGLSDGGAGVAASRRREDPAAADGIEVAGGLIGDQDLGELTRARAMATRCTVRRRADRKAAAFSESRPSGDGRGRSRGIGDAGEQEGSSTFEDGERRSESWKIWKPIRSAEAVIGLERAEAICHREDVAGGGEVHARRLGGWSCAAAASRKAVTVPSAAREICARLTDCSPA